MSALSRATSGSRMGAQGFRAQTRESARVAGKLDWCGWGKRLPLMFWFGFAISVDIALKEADTATSGFLRGLLLMSPELGGGC